MKKLRRAVGLSWLLAAFGAAGVRAEAPAAPASAGTLLPALSSPIHSCVSTSLLGLCPGAGFSHLRGSALALSGARRTVPNRFMQLVKLFMDDMQVASVGNVRIKLHLSFE